MSLSSISNRIFRMIEYIPFIAVLSIIVMDYYTFIFFYIKSKYYNNPIYYVFISIIFTCLIILTIISYLRTCFTSSAIELNLPNDTSLILYNNNNSIWPTCNKCEYSKPLRAHHCSICDVCILKMDHHCPWVMNCVGFRNYKFFILFCGYAFISALFYCFTTIPDWYASMTDYQSDISIGFTYMFSNILTIAFCFSLLFFVTFHLYLVSVNKTTIEYGDSMRNSSNISFYDLGKKANFESVFGKSLLLAFLPVANWEGDGYIFEVRESDDLEIGRPPVRPRVLIQRVPETTKSTHVPKVYSSTVMEELKSVEADNIQSIQPLLTEE